MGGNVYTGQNQNYNTPMEIAQNGSNFQFSNDYGIDAGAMNVNPNMMQGGALDTNSQSAFGSLGGWGTAGSLALGALSYFDQAKNNKVKRKSDKYALGRKQTEDAMYDKFHSAASGMRFKPVEQSPSAFAPQQAPVVV